MEIFGILIGFFVIWTLIMPWINQSRLNEAHRTFEALQSEIRALRNRIRQLEETGAHGQKEQDTGGGQKPLQGDIQALRDKIKEMEEAAPGGQGAESEPDGKEAAPKTYEVAKALAEKAKPPVKSAEPPEPSGAALPPTPSEPGKPEGSGTISPETEKKEAPAKRPDLVRQLETRFGFEANMGTRVAVWVGGVALLMAGFFLVKYSIETGLLTPAVRIVLATVFGGLLCWGGTHVSRTSELDKRIGQSLTGAGSAVLYFTVYAALHFYGFIGPSLGFLLMIGVTVMTVTFAMLHGAPIALLGLTGGYLTPVLIGSEDPGTASLFAYLFILFAGSQWIFVRKGWWQLSLLSLAAAYLWVVGWLIYGVPDGAFYLLNIYILLVAGVTIVVADSFKKLDSGEEAMVEAFKYLGLSTLLVGMVLGWVTSWMADFGIWDWCFFGILASATIALAWMRGKEYQWAPVFSCVSIFGAVMAWDAGFVVWLSTICAFTGLFAVAGTLGVQRKEETAIWRGLAIVPLVVLMPLAYFKWEVVGTWVPDSEYFWMVFAGCIALFLAAPAFWTARVCKWGQEDGARLFPLYILPAFGLPWISICIEMEGRAAYVAIAVLGLGSAGLWNRKHWAYCGFLPAAYGVAWLFFCLHPLMALAEDTFLLLIDQVDPGRTRPGILDRWLLYLLPMGVAVTWANVAKNLKQEAIDIWMQSTSLAFGFIAVTALTNSFLETGEYAVYVYPVIWALLGFAYLAWGLVQERKLARRVATWIFAGSGLLVYFQVALGAWEASPWLWVGMVAWLTVFFAKVVLEPLQQKHHGLSNWLLVIVPAVSLLPVLTAQAGIVGYSEPPFPYFWIGYSAFVSFLLSMPAFWTARVRSWEDETRLRLFPLSILPACLLLWLGVCIEMEGQLAWLAIACLGLGSAGLWRWKGWGHCGFLPAAYGVAWLYYAFLPLKELALDTSALVFGQDVQGSSPGIQDNFLLYVLPMGVAVAWARVPRYLRSKIGNPTMNPTALSLGFVDLTMQSVALGLGFIAATALTRDFIGTGELAIYAYSVVWLLLGIAYLAWGVWQKLKLPRSVAFGVLALTVLKVFLLDASELTGLYRVLSFLGLGVALLLIAYGYNRFIVRLDLGGKPEEELEKADK